ncbi:MAG: preprotein translocase subunit SecA [Acholeplasmatales bacterium]|jgi:preprotein translocase subunit SecA|nr:preprotein translocase subunit SecA [Acholeplasmatales bacterium]
MGFLSSLFDPTKKELKFASFVVREVNKLESQYRELYKTKEDFQQKTSELKERIKQGEILDDLMPEAFALVRQAAILVIGQRPYDVQIMGAVAIHNGNVAEMKTGEGKTLTAVMPAYLNALSGEPVHIVTVNEYLAKREAQGEIGDIFRFLGLTVGLNLREITALEKQAAYDCDIMYSTNSELGFDYLRDHMVLYAKDMVAQRGLSYAIIDEADSILIDEARTPLIISGGDKGTQNLYLAADRFAKSLDADDFNIDVESKSIELTEKGISKAEKIFNMENLYDLANVALVHRLNNALRANYIMDNNKDYMVSDNQVLIIDQFTGRVLPGRQFSEGLHQALEAKEGVLIKKETVTVATITYQNFFRMYKKLSGMTGTAKTEEEEFHNIYNMNVIVIPTNKPIVRIDEVDNMYVTLEEKFQAIVEEIVRRHLTGQPLLVGTISVEMSEYLASLLLKRREIKHFELLNAKFHEREAEIVAKAGLKGAITIATNMAGRGTDIKLGEGVVELGGLAVIGTERHEARRIDNQLRGRGGRQGDPGCSQFFISAEDDLLLRFGGERFKSYITTLARINGKGNPIKSKMLSNFVTSAQKKIEGNNFDARKNVLKYDDVIRLQREIVYKQRRECLTKESVEEDIKSMMNSAIEEELSKYVRSVGRGLFDIDDEAIVKNFNGNIFNPNYLDLEELKKIEDESQLIQYVKDLAIAEMNAKKAQVPPEIYQEFLKVVLLRVIDNYWMKHIDTMDELRQGVRLQSYGQNDPLMMYKTEGLRLFNEMRANMALDVTRYVTRSVIQVNTRRQEVVKNTSTNEGTKEAPKKHNKPKPNKYHHAPWHR